MIVSSFIFRGIKRDTALAIAGITRHQYYYKPKSGRRGKPPSQTTFKINGEDVEHRKVIVSKFLDKGDIWHCFFLTFKSLDGKENYHDGQPHLHYISSAWNIPRQEVKEQLTSKKYSLPSLPHIDFHTHRNPRE